jgi:hypothetical protein
MDEPFQKQGPGGSMAVNDPGMFIVWKCHQPPRRGAVRLGYKKLKGLFLKY